MFQEGLRAFPITALSVLLLVLCGGTASAEYSVGAAKTALQFAKASYCDSTAIGDWNCESCAEQPSFKVKRVYQNETLGVQAYSGVSSDRIIIAFRGSQNVLNWIANIDAFLMAYPNETCSGCKFHSGFAGSHYVLRDALWQDVQELVQLYPQFPILVTGHSLGGAMATICAVDLASQGYPTGVAPRIELYTFGSPRVGNQAYANWVAALFCAGGHESYRVTHKQDVVPHLPAMSLGFTHVGKEVWYNDDTADKYTICNDVIGDTCSAVHVEEDDSCSNSYVLPTSTSDHLLYLGICTSCSCEAAATTSDQVVKLSAATLEQLVDDSKYRQLRSVKS